MKKIILPKAAAISRDEKPIEGVVIDITRDIPDLVEIDSLESAKIFYDKYAETLANALMDSLPQGVIEPLTIKLLERRVSLYRGTME